jgi:ABC-type oligopeptide transport system substrate-binding subunit
VHDWLHRVNTPLSSTNTQAIRNGWAQDYPDPQDYISLLFRCGNAYDISEWCNSKFDKLVDLADKTGSNAQRTKLYSQAQVIALNNGIPVMYDNGVFRVLISKHVKGLNLFLAWSDIVPKNLDWSTVSVS